LGNIVNHFVFFVFVEKQRVTSIEYKTTE